MLANYQNLALILSFLVICEQWSFPNGDFCSALCKPNNCTDITTNGCKSCDNNFMRVGTTCVVNPTSGWSLVDTSADLSGALMLNSTTSGTCGSYSYFGNMTSN